MTSPANNPNQGNQKGGKQNSNAADKPKKKDETSADRKSEEVRDEQDAQIRRHKGQVGNTGHGG